MDTATLQWSFKHDEYFKGSLEVTVRNVIDDNLESTVRLIVSSTHQRDAVTLNTMINLGRANVAEFVKVLTTWPLASRFDAKLLDDDSSFCLWIGSYDDGESTVQMTLDCFYPGIITTANAGNAKPKGLLSDVGVHEFAASCTRILLGGAIIDAEHFSRFCEDMKGFVRMRERA